MLQPMNERGGGPGPVAATAALIGGLLLVLGSLLAWVETSGPLTHVAVRGIRSREGKIALACGLVLIVATVVAWASSAAGTRRMVLVAGLVAALVASGFILYDVVTKDRQIDDALRSTIELRTGRILTDREVARARALLARRGFSIDFRPGIWVALAGGVVGAVGAARGAASVRPAPTAGAPGFGFGGLQPPDLPAAPPGSPEAPPGSPEAPPDPMDPTDPTEPVAPA